jgi:hypothetical protein
LHRLGQQAKDRDAASGADVDPSVDDHGSDEFVAAEVVAVVGGLIGIVEFLGEVGGVESVKNGAAVFDGPDDPVGGACCRRNR